MEKCTPAPGSDSPGFIRRRPQRRRILEVLHGICLKIEQLQQSEDARLACREVAQMLGEARLREGVRNRPRKT
ncbi:MAG: hypothetical protein K0R17_3226 [Rariglobus sp.]|nr:hypothetical protein [Rariglobus sp.]